MTDHLPDSLNNDLTNNLTIDLKNFKNLNIANIPTRRTLQLPNIELSYLEWHSNKNDNPEKKLLLLHGLADLALVWTSLGDNLASEYHIVAPDMRGHGESSKPKTGYSFQETINDLEALMQHLGWEKAHILGHSWTGKLSTIWAQQHQERFISMILVDPIFIMRVPSIFKLSFPILYRTLETLKGMGPFASLEEAQAQAQTLGKYSGWSALQELVWRAGLYKNTEGQWVSKFTIPARNEIFAEVMDVAGLTSNIEQIPSLFIQSENGVNRMDWQIRPYQKYIKNLRMAKVPGNHWAFLVAPTEFNQTVSQFLAHNF